VLLATSAPLFVVATLAVPLAAKAADVTVSGVVRDSSGIPQMDVLVQLMRADSTILQSVRTDEHGTYLIAGVLPGVYQLKAIETSFLPTLRENLRVNAKGRTEANLTLSTLMEALNWLPAHKRSPSEPDDDWTWTLRSSAYRPLLRYVDSDGLETIDLPESSHSRKKGRLLIESGTRTFADGGFHQTVEFQHQDLRGGQSMVRGSVGDTAGGPAALMAGYSQRNEAGSGLTTVLSYQSNPEIAGAGAGGPGVGLQSVNLRTVDTLRLLPDLVVEAGNQLQVFSLGTQSSTVARPFANLAWSHGDTTASYTVSSTPRVEGSAGISDAASFSTLAGEQNGTLRIEHGLHQELKIGHAGPVMDVSAAIYDDRIDDPVIDAMGQIAHGDFASGDYLLDPSTGLARVIGADYSSNGIVMQVRHQGRDSVYESVEYATGSALNAPEPPASSALKAAPAFHPESAQSLALAVGGKTPRTGTTWRAAYRLQPGNSVTAVDLFDAGVDTGMADAYLSVFLRQPLHRSRIFPGGVDAIVNVRNLLAQGYHPFLTSDGSTLFFAQVDRSVQGGLAFYF
jgi:hypothetical protein